MMKLTIKKENSTENLSALKDDYMASTTAVLDGMWLFGFVPMAEHFGFYDGEKLVGFYCVNDEGYVLQFYLSDAYLGQSVEMFNQLFELDSPPTEQIKGAIVSTGEPRLLSLCLDRFEGYAVNTLMYQQLRDCAIQSDTENAIKLRLVVMDELMEMVDFATVNVGMPAEWTTGYYTNLIGREELWGHWIDDCLIAVGECRGRDEYQTGYVDLGMIVAEGERGKGIGTRVLKSLIKIAEAKGLKAICSTEVENIGSQKAIERAGFFAGHRILQFDVNRLE